MTGLLVDQQLPRALAAHLKMLGHDAKHIKEYPSGTTLDDVEIARIADAEGRIVVTKDEDFRVSHLLTRHPARLLHVTCGNISTSDLLALIDQHYSELVPAIDTYSYIEIDRPGVIIHDPS
jgi:predicted nuclease of predicted toxin-antitoxin system